MNASPPPITTVPPLRRLLTGDPAQTGAWMRLMPGCYLVTSLIWIGLGAGLYGAAIGWWRDPMQSVFNAIKFPLILSWLAAVGFGLRLLTRSFTALGARTTGAFLGWSAIFVLVAMQMMTSLRPIIGTSDRLLTGEKTFFLKDWGETMKMTPETR